VELTNGTTLELGNIKGADGIGISKSEINSAGELVLTYSNGQISNLGKVVGTDGSNGADGRGIQNVTLSASGDLSVVLTDNTVLTLGNVKGEKGDKGDKGDKGEKGDKGDPGEDGRGIADMKIVNGELIVTYTDGTQDNLGSVSTGEPTVDSRLIFTLQDDGTYEVTLDTKYRDTVTSISIPSMYNGLPVTTIGWSAFENCPLLTTVHMPDSIKTIGWKAFLNCRQLTNVKLPQSLKKIESAAFQKCTLLTSVIIPKGVTFIGHEAFWKSGLQTAYFEVTENWYYSPPNPLAEDENGALHLENETPDSIAKRLLSDTFTFDGKIYGYIWSRK